MRGPDGRPTATAMVRGGDASVLGGRPAPPGAGRPVRRVGQRWTAAGGGVEDLVHRLPRVGPCRVAGHGVGGPGWPVTGPRRRLDWSRNGDSPRRGVWGGRDAGCWPGNPHGAYSCVDMMAERACGHARGRPRVCRRTWPLVGFEDAPVAPADRAAVTTVHSGGGAGRRWRSCSHDVGRTSASDALRTEICTFCGTPDVRRASA